MRYDEAYLLYRNYRLDEALLAIHDCMEDCGPDASLHNLKGLIFGMKGQSKRQIDAYRLASELNPHNPVFKGNLGCALAEAKQYPQAIAAIRAALSMDQDLSYLYEWLGDVYRDQGNEELASKEYKRGLLYAERDVNRNEYVLEHWQRYERLLRNVGEYDKADEAHARAVKLERDGHFGSDSSNIIAGKDSGLWLEE